MISLESESESESAKRSRRRVHRVGFLIDERFEKRRRVVRRDLPSLNPMPKMPSAAKYVELKLPE